MLVDCFPSSYVTLHPSWHIRKFILPFPSCSHLKRQVQGVNVTYELLTEEELERSEAVGRQREEQGGEWPVDDVENFKGMSKSPATKE